MKRDIVVSLFCLAGSIALFFTLGTIEENRARIFPEVVIIVMIILSALLLLQNLARKGAKQVGGKPFPWFRFSSLFALIVLYFLVMQSIGFYLSTFLFFVTVSIAYGYAGLTKLKAFHRVLQSAVFTGVLYVLFKVLLEVQTPRGIFL